LADRLDRGDRAVADAVDRRLAGANRLAVEMHGASAAQRLTAAELGPGHAEYVAQHSQQRDVAVNIDLMGCAVDLQRESHACLSLAGADRKQPADLESAGRLRASNGRAPLTGERG
jgi:hypothetical protein